MRAAETDGPGMGPPGGPALQMELSREWDGYPSSRGNRARLIRVCRTTATTVAPTIAPSPRMRAGKTIAAIPPEMFDPIARWLPGGAPDDVA